MTRPIVIAFEGIDASGKSTQAEILRQSLANLKIPVTRLNFPDVGETVSGNIIRQHLAGRWKVTASKMSLSEQHLDAAVFQMLQVVNRMEQLPTSVWSDSKNSYVKRFLILDRYKMSGEVYGTTDGLSRNWIKKIQTPLPAPDMTIILDVGPDSANKRLAQREESRDRYESLPPDSFIKQADIYKSFLTDTDPDIYTQHGFVVGVSADLSVSCVGKAVLGQVIRLINEWISLDTFIREDLSKKLLGLYQDYEK